SNQANTTGLDATAANSKLSFIGTVQQTVSCGNQTFSGVNTAPDVDVSNNSGTSTGGLNFNNWFSSAVFYIKNLNVLSGGYMQVSANINVNVSGNLTNNGTIFAPGATTGAII